MATTVSPETISHIGNVVQRFRERMIASNRAYLRDVAQVIAKRENKLCRQGIVGEY
jgi:hypothetical protein